MVWVEVTTTIRSLQKVINKSSLKPMTHFQSPSSNQCQGRQRVWVMRWAGKWVTGGNNMDHLRDFLLAWMNWTASQDSGSGQHREAWDVFPFHGRSVAELCSHLENAHTAPLYFVLDMSVSLGGCMVLGLYWSLCEELRALGSRVNPPLHVRGSQEAGEEHSIRKHSQSHVGLSRSTVWLAKNSHLLIRGTSLFPSHACSHQVEVTSISLGSLFPLSSKHHITGFHGKEEHEKTPPSSSIQPIIWLWSILGTLSEHQPPHL